MSVVVEPFGERYCPSCETGYGEGVRCPRDGAQLIRLSVGHDPNLGRELDGRFTLLERLGEGGMGVVYRARQHSVDREVAVKVIRANRTSDPDAMKRFLREVKLTSRINHPNAIGALDFGQTGDGLLYLVMELVTGRTLDRVIASEGLLAPARVVKIGTQICDALAAAHELQIIHRDLKPGNVMLLARDFVKVLDFGLATTLGLEDHLSASGDGRSIVGTPAYLPPERARDGSGDGRSDLYSLGCLLFALASGRPPFRATSSSDVVAMHAGRSAPRLVDVPPALGDVIERLLAKDPAARYQTAAETRAALEEAARRESLGRPRTHDGVVVATASPPAGLPAIQGVGSPGPQPAPVTQVVVLATPRRTTHAFGLALIAACISAVVIGLALGDEQVEPNPGVAAPPRAPMPPPPASTRPAGDPGPAVGPRAPVVLERAAPELRPPRPLAGPARIARPGKAAPRPADATPTPKPRLPF